MLGGFSKSPRKRLEIGQRELEGVGESAGARVEHRPPLRTSNARHPPRQPRSDLRMPPTINRAQALGESRVRLSSGGRAKPSES
jgi:hypothetical protein